MCRTCHFALQTNRDVQKELKALFQLEKGSANDQKGAAFLHDFLSKQLWAQEGDDGGDSAGLFRSDLLAEAGDEGMSSEEEEEFLDAADDFERSYNFRCAFGKCMVLAIQTCATAG